MNKHIASRRKFLAQNLLLLLQPFYGLLLTRVVQDYPGEPVPER